MSLLYLEPALPQAPPNASTSFFSPPSDLINPRRAFNFSMLMLTSSTLYLSVGTVDCLKEDSGKSDKKFENGAV